MGNTIGLHRLSESEWRGVRMDRFMNKVVTGVSVERKPRVRDAFKRFIVGIGKEKSVSTIWVHLDYEIFLFEANDGMTYELRFNPQSGCFGEWMVRSKTPQNNHEWINYKRLPKTGAGKEY